MDANSDESVCNGTTGPKPPHKHSSHASKRQLAQWRISGFSSQPSSQEPSAYRASFNNADIATSEEQGEARIGAELERIMTQLNGS
ncbi:hypothetical protein LX36DRAFT_746144 [Colletotrichum falcatum]|nr:hypothetical protein LX36DRAFT_746144 [Colletotrichum falcatum]